jgi:hypothetical protein
MNRYGTAVIVVLATGTAGCSGAGDGVAPVHASAIEPGGGTSSTDAFVRLVNLVSDAPAFDVCLRTHGTDPSSPFDVGPLFARGIASSEASAYVGIAPGAYDVRIVPGGASDCATRLDGIPDRTDAPTFEPQGYASIVAVGSLGKSFLGLDVHADERSVSPGRAKLRFVHGTMAAPALDVGTGAGDGFVPLFAGVSFRSVGAGDANGYVEIAPNSDATLVLRVAGRTFDTLTVPGFAFADETITTLFSIGFAGQGGKLVGSMLRCSDAPNDVSASSCAVVP